MQDLSQVTGSQTPVKIDGREVLLGGYTFEDIGTLQGEVLRAKRKAKLQVALAAGDILPPDKAQAEWDRARTEAENVVLVKEDFDAFLGTNEGIATLLWILTERYHPGQFTRPQILRSMTSGELTEEQMLDLVQSLEAVQQKGKKSS